MARYVILMLIIQPDRSIGDAARQSCSMEIPPNVGLAVHCHMLWCCDLEGLEGLLF